MTKEELIAMGMSTEQADKVIAKQTEEMKAFVPRARLDEETSKVTSLNTQLADRDKDIKALQAAAGKGSELEKQLTDLQAKYTADTDAFQKQLADQKLDAAIDAALNSVKLKDASGRARDPVSVKAHIDKSKLKLKDDGSIDGLDIETLVKNKPYLFEIETTKNEGPDFKGGSSGGASQNNQNTSIEDAIASFYTK